MATTHHTSPSIIPEPRTKELVGHKTLEFSLLFSSQSRVIAVPGTMAASDDISLAARLADPSRPLFLLGEVPPGFGTPPGKCAQICSKFAARSRALATDGFIVYDIQDEPGRSDMQRPFPFRKLMDSSPYASLLARTSGKPCLVYKCVADEQFDDWIDVASQDHGHTAVNLVGRASSEGDYQGPTLAQAMVKVKQHAGLRFGGVCIAERHTMESAKARGKDYPTEHLNMVRKQVAGAEWFISQAVYDVEPTIRLLQDYAAVCRQRGLTPQKVVLTFAPVSRSKTMNFLKWLGVRVPQDVEASILQSESPVEESIQILCRHLETILQECSNLGVPLGISCESVSIFKAEIDGVHELFRRLQSILMDHRGSPWKVQWVDCPRFPLPTSIGTKKDEKEQSVVVASRLSPESAALLGALTGGTLVAVGVLLGGGRK